MLQRVKQFFSAIHAKVSVEDLRFVDIYLVGKEKNLFLNLDLPTQRHSINVARTAIQLAKSMVPGSQEQPKLDIKLLVKASLLHDIGKPAGGLKTWHRVFIVLLERVKIKPVGLKYPLYLQKNHPILGGVLARENNLDSKVVDIIENHHTTLKETSSLELRILQKADDLN